MIRIQEMSSMFQINSNESPACEGMDVNFFYPVGESNDDNAWAKDNVYPQLRKVCGNCDVLDKCRDWAIKHEEWGFWGGMSVYERRQLRKKYKIKLEQPWTSGFLKGIK
jgi:hypothetical protein